ncbi:MAG: hypothetical protein HN849_31285 [Victivallales bacterium]|jgi:hypothetical protein|nr:hypothetical protein [Victivallales bacterium]
MPRRRRCWERQACYHITHRCHNREFRFRFEKCRRLYRQYLFEATKRFNVRVLSWMVTSNHTHLLVTGGDRGTPQISEALQFVHGEIAQHYNLARRCDGSGVATSLRAVADHFVSARLGCASALEQSFPFDADSERQPFGALPFLHRPEHGPGRRRGTSRAVALRNVAGALRRKAAIPDRELRHSVEQTSDGKLGIVCTMVQGHSG